MHLFALAEGASAVGAAAEAAALPAPTVGSGQILATLLLCGLLGTLGQGIRATVGLKNAALLSQAKPNQQSEFNAAYLAISLMIGFIAGIVAALAIGIDKLMRFDPGDLKVLVGIAGSGYAGADFIENAFSTIMPATRRTGGQTGAGDQVADKAQSIGVKLDNLDAKVSALAVPTHAQATPPVAGVDASMLAAALKIAAPRLNAGVWTPALATAFAKFDLATNRRVAAAVGQFLVEAGASFQELSEDLNYTSAERICEVFPRLFPTAAGAQPYVGKPEALANVVYANRLGNGDAASGDGYNFRGRGLVQITGRAAYAQFAAAVGKTIETVGPYCTTPEGAAMSGCWYLATRGCLSLADAWDIDGVTLKVNGNAMLGAAQRRDYSNAALKALGG